MVRTKVVYPLLLIAILQKTMDVYNRLDITFSRPVKIRSFLFCVLVALFQVISLLLCSVSCTSELFKYVLEKKLFVLLGSEEMINNGHSVLVRKVYLHHIEYNGLGNENLLLHL